MRSSKNYWFRWGIGASAIGLIIPPAYFLGLKRTEIDLQSLQATASWANLKASGISALVFLSLSCGLAFGVMGLSVATIRKCAGKSANE